MLESVSVRAYAKINLSLRAHAREIDTGYHRLDTVMVSVSLYNTVTLTRLSGNTVEVYLDGRPTPRTNAGAAAKAMQAFGAGGMRVEICRGIPNGCGLGGSSADAAGVMRAAIRLFGLSVPASALLRAAAAVGSDVPFMLTGGLQRLTGTGAELVPIDASPDLNGIIAAKGEISTAACFAAFDRLPAPRVFPDNDRLSAALLSGDTAAVYAECDNDLTDAAISLNPAVGDALFLMRKRVAHAVMTGSGAGVVGFSPGDPSQLTQSLSAHGFAVYPFRTLNSGIEFI